MSLEDVHGPSGWGWGWVGMGGLPPKQNGNTGLFSREGCEHLSLEDQALRDHQERRLPSTNILANQAVY